MLQEVGMTCTRRDRPPSLGDLLMDLGDLLGGLVDVIPPAALQKQVRARVVCEAVLLWRLTATIWAGLDTPRLSLH